MGDHEKKKSLLYLSVYDPHVPLTGAGTRGAEFVNNLALYFNLDLVYLDGSGQPPIPELSRKYASRLEGVRHEKRIAFSQFDYFVFSRSLYSEARRFLEKNDYDFILCDYGLSALYGMLLQRKFNIPFIYCSHNVEYVRYLKKAKQDVRRMILMPYMFFVEKYGVGRSKIVVPISNDDADHFLSKGWTFESLVLTIPQGFDENVFNPFYDPPANDPKIVLFCGNYGIGPNRDVIGIVMDRIMNRVLAKHPGTIFKFVGANPPQDIQHPNVEFTGFVEDYPSCLKEADVFISPLEEGWGFPTKIVESLACGKPTIATPTGARAIEGNYRNLLIHDLNQFPEAICSALTRAEPVSKVDFEMLKIQYSWRENIHLLAERIEKAS